MPANSKKSGLILGLFNVKDLIVLGIGLGITAILVFLCSKGASLIGLVLIMTPGAISVLLVFPVPYYHNVMKLMSNIIMFFMNKKKYEWKGWIDTDEK